MSSFYLPLLHTHIALVSLSVFLFFARGLGVLAGMHWPMQKTWRITSVLIDTLLMAAGITLWIALDHDPFDEAWLGIKLALLLVYIVLGTYALKRANNRRQKTVFFFLALICAFTMITLATTRSPWAWIAYF